MDTDHIISTCCVVESMSCGRTRIKLMNLILMIFVKFWVPGFCQLDFVGVSFGRAQRDR